MPLFNDTPSVVAGSDGFTLIELLVSILCGIVVIMALFMIMDVTLDQSTRTFTRLDALERARVKLQQVENELHSACAVDGLQPILSGSSATQLEFESYYGNAAAPVPVEHIITFNSAAGTLTDSTYPETSETEGTHPTFTFSSTATKTVNLLTNVSQSGSTPVFQYFAYGPVPEGSGYYEDPDGNEYEILQDGQSYVPGTTVTYTNDLVNSSSPTLTSTNAPTVAEVMMTLYAGPTIGEHGIVSSSKDTQGSDADLTVQDSVVLRLTDPANHAGAGASFGPCD